jgi:hypothetical protein
MEFVGLLSSGKGTWGQVIGLIKREEWDKIILVGDSYAKKRIVTWDLQKTINKNIEFVEIDFDRRIADCIEEIKKKLKDRIKGVGGCFKHCKRNWKGAHGIDISLNKLASRHKVCGAYKRRSCFYLNNLRLGPRQAQKFLLSQIYDSINSIHTF